MAFTSASFFLYFLPVFLILFRIATRGGVRLSTIAKITIIFGTYVFYGFENLGYLIPFVFATLMDLLWSHLLRKTDDPSKRKLIVTLSVIQNLSIFFVFKYLNWVAAVFPHSEILQNLHGAFADNSGTINLPPGVSFYLFESLSFVIDCYRREIETPKNPLNFLTFISMFPRFIAGPIVRYKDLQNSIKEYRGMRVADGLFIFAIGFSIKILFADSMEKFVTPLFAKNFSFYSTWTCVVAYTFQIYLDFSGYSLMAIGLGVIIGFPFLDNFREPYQAHSITDFWRRWHISLSTWLRDYLYISLGGNRKGKIRTQVNLFLTMLLGGLWHGANITYIIWGAYHGIILALEKRFGVFKNRIFQKIFTFLLVMIGWVFFRANSLKDAGHIFKGLGGFSGFSSSEVREVISRNSMYSWLAIIAVIWVFVLEPRVRVRRLELPWHELSIERVDVAMIVLVAISFLLSILLVMSAQSVPFLYFQF